MYSSAPVMSHVPEELVGHVNRLQGSLLFTYFRLERGPISFIYPPSAARASRRQIDAFIAKRGSRPKPAVEVLDRLEAQIHQSCAHQPEAHTCYGHDANTRRRSRETGTSVMAEQAA
jgi:hypothetical protein